MEVYYNFNPRSPWGERHLLFKILIISKWFQSTLSVRRATWLVKSKDTRLLFQSTLSVRRATPLHCRSCLEFPDFNPRSPWGERLSVDILESIAYTISIHALREESDTNRTYTRQRTQRFQSTLSVRRATKFSNNIIYTCQISIHALREESDIIMKLQITVSDISIHALREESDRGAKGTLTWLHKFQSTLSVRRATIHCSLSARPKSLISIHALREESDNEIGMPVYIICISIHALREESDNKD